MIGKTPMERVERDRQAREDFARAFHKDIVVPLQKLTGWIDRQIRRWPWLYRKLS